MKRGTSTLKRSRIASSKAARARRQERVLQDAEWAMAVKTRDDHTCRRCGYRDEHNNHAHHLATRSQRPDLVHVLSNGITVCLFCHTYIHNYPIEAHKAGLLSDETYEKSRRESIDNSEVA